MMFLFDSILLGFQVDLAFKILLYRNNKLCFLIPITTVVYVDVEKNPNIYEHI